MKHLLLILSILLTCTAAQAQRYRLVADSFYSYNNGGVFDVDSVLEYKYRADNATNEYDTFFRYEYEYGEPLLKEKQIKIKDKHGLVDSMYRYRAVLRYELDLESITVHNRDGNGLLRSTDVYGLVYCQADPYLKRDPRYIPPRDMVIDGEKMTIVYPEYSGQVKQPKQFAKYLLTQKDSFEYKDGKLWKERRYRLFADGQASGNIEKYDYDELKILSKCVGVFMYRDSKVVKSEEWNVPMCDWDEYYEYKCTESKYDSKGKLLHSSTYVVTGSDTVLYDTSYVMHDVYGRNSVYSCYSFENCTAYPTVVYYHYDRKGRVKKIETFECEDFSYGERWDMFWLHTVDKIKYDRKGRVKARRINHYDGSYDEYVGYDTEELDYTEGGNVHSRTNYKAVTDIRGKTIMSPYRKHTYTYEEY